MKMVSIVERNAAWYRKSGIARPVISNFTVSKDFHDYALSKGITISYWSDVHELPEVQGADLFIDEIGRYFDSRLYKDLSADVRGWLAQASKLGVEMYTAAQDFAQIDITYRRLTNHLYQITKLIGSPRPTNTRPPVKRIWGICVERELDPVAYDEDSKKFASDGLPGFFFIERKYCDVFDTTQRFRRSAPLPYEHVKRSCKMPGCTFVKVSHV